MFLAGCGGGGGGGSASTSSSTTVSLDGIGSKGLFANADVQAFEVVGGQLVSLGSSTKTGSDGSYSLTGLRTTTNPVVVKLTVNAATTMLDETSVGADGKFTVSANKPPVGTEIRSTLPDLTTNSEAHITPFTEMAVAAAASSGTLNSASLLAGRQMVMDTLGLNPFTIKPVNADATMSTDQAKMMLLLTSVAQDAKTACTGDPSGVTCAVRRLTDQATLTKGSDGNFAPQSAAALKTKIDSNVTNVKTEITAGRISGTFANNVKNQTISTTAPTSVNPTTAAAMASLEGFVNSFRTGFNKAANSVTTMAKATQTRTKDIVLKTIGGTAGNIDSALRNCLSTQGLVCAAGSTFTKISDNNYSFSGKSLDNSMDISGTISGSYVRSTGALSLNVYEVYKKPNTETKLYEVTTTASGTGIYADSQSVSLVLTRLDAIGYDTTAGSIKWVKVDLSGTQFTASETNRTFSLSGGLTVSTNGGDSFAGTLTTSGKKIPIAPNSSTYDWAAESAALSVTAKSANALVVGFSVDATNDLTNYYPKLKESSSNIQKGTYNFTMQFTDSTKIIVSGSKSNLTDKLFTMTVSTDSSWVSASGTLTTQPNGAPDDINSDGLTVTSSGSYSAVIKKGGASDLKKGATKVGEIKSDGWYVDGKKFVVEPITLDLGIQTDIFSTAVVASAVANKADPVYQDITQIQGSGSNATLVVIGRTCIANC